MSARAKRFYALILVCAKIWFGVKVLLLEKYYKKEEYEVYRG